MTHYSLHIYIHTVYGQKYFFGVKFENDKQLHRKCSNISALPALMVILNKPEYNPFELIKGVKFKSNGVVIDKNDEKDEFIDFL